MKLVLLLFYSLGAAITTMVVGFETARFAIFGGAIMLGIALWRWQPPSRERSLPQHSAGQAQLPATAGREEDIGEEQFAWAKPAANEPAAWRHSQYYLPPDVKAPVEVWWPTEVRLSIRTTNAFWPAFEALLTHEEDYRRGKRAKLKGEMVLVAHWREPVDSTVVEVWMDGYQVGEMTRHFSNQYYQPITKIGGAIVVNGWISAEAPDRYTKSGHRGGFRLCRPELIEKPVSALAYGAQTLPFGGKVPIVGGESFAPAVAEILGKRERRLAYLTLRLAMSEAAGYKARIEVFFGEHQVGYLSEADSSALLHRVQAIEANGLIAAARGSFIQGEEGTRGYLHVKRTSRANADMPPAARALHRPPSRRAPRPGARAPFSPIRHRARFSLELPTAQAIF